MAACPVLPCGVPGPGVKAEPGVVPGVDVCGVACALESCQVPMFCPCLPVGESSASCILSSMVDPSDGGRVEFGSVRCCFVGVVSV